MGESIGTLVDKISVVNIKIALHENERRNYGLSDQERLAESDACMELNRQRNQLVTELDELFAKVLNDPSQHTIHRKVAIYGGKRE